MRIEYSRGADALYVHFREVDVDRSQDVAEGIVLDFDGAGEIVGLEILDVSSRLSPQELVNVSIQNLPVDQFE